MKLLLTDLDGTIRRTKSGKPFINSPEDQELIPGVEDILKSYQDWYHIGITNQGGVKAGYKSLVEANLEQYQTIKICPSLKFILFCPDDGDACYQASPDGFNSSLYTRDGNYPSFRKPGCGMLTLALAIVQRRNQISEILYIGDREEDRLAAKEAGFPFRYVDQWHELSK
jgi:D-glycero-D-manno-heptose 1,7-bisphosphate phosphatase